ncbi:MAG TPA: hypothetical protein VHC96_21440 [Puia sp.]|nr:hypothetical protein [Puia sp.]
MPVLRICGALSLCLCLLITGCKKSSSGPDNGSLPDVVDNHQQPMPTAVGTPVGGPVSKVIGAGGGVLYSPDSVLKLTIPAGALSSNTNISIQPVTSQLPGGIGLGYDLLPNGTKFSIPATVTFQYTSDEVSDNYPYFLNIAYQDSNHIWRGDLAHCVYDTVARTVSLDIRHFTIYGFQDGITVLAIPREIMTGQTSSLTIFESIVIRQDSSYITTSTDIPSDFVGQWTVNGVPNGNSSIGTVTGSGANVVYHAPAKLDAPIEVLVECQLKMHEIIFTGGQKIDLLRPKRGVRIRVWPYKEYDFTVKLFYYDSTVSGFFHSAPSPPVYSDHAQFDVHLKAKLDAPEIELSNLQNYPPEVSSASFTYGNSVWTWTPDPYGMMDVSGLTLNHEPILDDSLVTVYVNHGHAMLYGYVSYTNGQLIADVSPAPFTVSYGIPPTFVMDLKLTPPYLKTIAGGGKSVSYAILPKQ